MSDRDSSHFGRISLLGSKRQEALLLDLLFSNARLDIISFLPREVAVFVLEHLPATDLCRVQQVSRIWFEACQHSTLQLKIKKFRLKFVHRKENSMTSLDRLHRRLSTGMINRNLDSPFASLQAASPTPEESLVSSSLQRCSSESIVEDFQRFGMQDESLQLVRPRPQVIHLFTRPWTPTQESDSPLVGSKASKRQLKRF